MTYPAIPRPRRRSVGCATGASSPAVAPGGLSAGAAVPLGLRVSPFCPSIVLPPCLIDAYDTLCDALISAEEALHDLERAVIVARGWPDPDEPVES
jgi:hypothetical protein